MRLSPILVLTLLAACQANASVSAKANTSGDMKGEASGDMSDRGSSSPQTTSTAPQQVTSPPPQQVTATGSSCPFECFIADGASSLPVAADEQQRLHGAFATTMGGIQQCIGGSGWSRRRSSPVLNVRVNFKGEVTDVGVDARGYEMYDSCITGVSRPLPDGAYSGPSTIRCSERCVQPTRTRGRGKAGAKADAPVPASSTTPAQ